MYKTPFETAYTALTGDGAQWVADAGIKFVGIDYLSIARYEELATAHQNLMQAVSLALTACMVCHTVAACTVRCFWTVLPLLYLR